MEDEPHEVVKLLLARMESHPEEFTNATDRGWGRQIDLINVYGNEADVAAINAGMRNVRLAEAHSEVMDELLNGDERRAREKEEAAYEQGLMQKAAMQQYNGSGYLAVANGGTDNTLTNTINQIKEMLGANR